MQRFTTSLTARFNAWRIAAIRHMQDAEAEHIAREMGTFWDDREPAAGFEAPDKVTFQ